MRIQRHATAQALVEGVVALALIVTFTIGALVLLANTAIAFYYKDKLAYCSNQAAQFACTLPATANLTQETTVFSQFFLPRIGVTPRQLSVRAQRTTFQGRDAIFVTVSNVFPLFGNLTFLPGTLSLQDDGGAIFPTIAVAGAGPAGPPGPPGPPGPAATNSLNDAPAFLRMGPLTGGTYLYMPIAQAGNGQHHAPTGFADYADKAIFSMPPSAPQPMPLTGPANQVGPGVTLGGPIGTP